MLITKVEVTPVDLKLRQPVHIAGVPELSIVTTNHVRVGLGIEIIDPDAVEGTIIRDLFPIGREGWLDARAEQLACLLTVATHHPDAVLELICLVPAIEIAVGHAIG